MANDITILSCPICNYPDLRECGNGIYQCDFCETHFDKDENIVLTEQEWLQTATTEQLAEWIVRIVDCEFCPVKKPCKNQPCKKQIEKWLKQPHKE